MADKNPEVFGKIPAICKLAPHINQENKILSLVEDPKYGIPDELFTYGHNNELVNVISEYYYERTPKKASFTNYYEDGVHGQNGTIVKNIQCAKIIPDFNNSSRFECVFKPTDLEKINKDTSRIKSYSDPKKIPSSEDGTIVWYDRSFGIVHQMDWCNLCNVAKTTKHVTSKSHQEYVFELQMYHKGYVALNNTIAKKNIIDAYANATSPRGQRFLPKQIDDLYVAWRATNKPDWAADLAEGLEENLIWIGFFEFRVPYTKADPAAKGLKFKEYLKLKGIKVPSDVTKTHNENGEPLCICGSKYDGGIVSIDFGVAKYELCMLCSDKMRVEFDSFLERVAQ